MIFLCCQNMFSDMFCKMDWKQFIPSLIATVVGGLAGIFVPFWLQSKKEKIDNEEKALSEKRENREKAFIILGQIKDELNDVLTDLKNDNKYKAEDLHIDPITTPVWDRLKNTNELSLLTIIPNDKLDWLKDLYSIYDSIDKFNKWTNIYTENVTNVNLLLYCKPLQLDKNESAEIVQYIKDGIDGIREKLRKLKIKDKDDKEETNTEGIPYIVQTISDIIDEKRSEIS